MKITIYGAGYVGLVTGFCLSELGHNVLIMDVDATKIANLNHGILPIYEPGLEELLKRNKKRGRIAFTTDLKESVKHGLFLFIAVGTPSANDDSADLRYVQMAAEGIGQYISDYRIIVNKSTVPVGAALKVKNWVNEKLISRKSKIDFDVVSNPEFLKQGDAVNDFMKPDRIIVGADNERALKHLHQLYAPLDDSGQRFIAMDITSAELTKYVANAYLATRISFMNEMSQLAEYLGADIDVIRRGIGSDKRIGQHFLNAGCGFGGSCFPKDVRALKHMAQQVGFEPHLLSAIEVINHRQKRVLFNKISHYFKKDLTNKVIALWGLAFKPNTDDMREASSCVLMEALWEQGVQIQAYDPAALAVARQLYGSRSDLVLCNNPEETLSNADALVVVTEWDEFRRPNFELIKQKLHYPVVFDGRNLYDLAALATHGLNYYAIGRGNKL